MTGPVTVAAGAIVIMRGRMAVNVLPAPGVLRTMTRPPCASAIFFVSASPSPVPWYVFPALAPLGYRAASVASAAAGRRAAEARPPAAVVLDLLMPEMDGFEFAERFREMEAARGVPIIIWTSKDLTAAERQRLRDSAQAVIVKRGTTAEGLVDELRACGVRDGR